MNRDSEQANTDGVDVLRGIAILMVIVYHACGPLYGYYLPWDGWTRNFQASPSRELLWFYPLTFGWAGVALFFVISGFCIHYSYLRSGKFNARAFYWRRFWRIYPAFLLSLIIFSGWMRLDILTVRGAGQFVAHALFLHNLSRGTFFGINPSFWSIATEVQLYLLFPAMLFLRGRLGIVGCLASTFAVSCAWRLLAIGLFGFPDHLINWVWSSPFMTWFDWSIGAYVAERFYLGRNAFPRPLAWISLLLLVFLTSTLVKPLTVFSFTLAALISGVVLDMALHREWQDTTRVRSLIFLGIISYSLYLWHQPLLFVCVGKLTLILNSPAAAWLALGPLLVAGAWLSFRFVERPGIFCGRWLWNRFVSSKGNVLNSGE